MSRFRDDAEDERLQNVAFLLKLHCFDEEVKTMK